MEKELRTSLKSFSLELAVYAAMVAVYYFLVLEFLGEWLHHMFEHDRRLYAMLALLLIIAQGVVLESLTRWLLAWLKPRKEDL